MTDTANRVLSLAEVMALEEGARVWVEDATYEFLSSECVVEHNHFNGDHIIDICLRHGECYWTIEGLRTLCDVRVWSLPQPPTPEEIEANPWRKEGEVNT